MMTRLLILSLAVFAITQTQMLHGDEREDELDALGEYLTNESEVNDGLCVFFQFTLVETLASGEFGVMIEQVGRVVRQKEKLRVDQRYSVLNDEMVAKPLFWEVSLQHGPQLWHYDPLGPSKDRVQSFNKDEVKEDDALKTSRIRAKRIDPMMLAVCGYGNFLRGPDRNWATRMFGDAEVLGTQRLKSGGRQVLLGFPKAGVSCAVVTYKEKEEFLPSQVEWKMSPDAKRADAKPTVEEALKWTTHDVGRIEWANVDGRWVPKLLEHVQEFAGKQRRYEVRFDGWSFDEQKVEELVSAEKFKEKAGEAIDFDNLMVLFPLASEELLKDNSP